MKPAAYAKYHALGNDYLVIEPAGLPVPDPQLVRLICHRHFGAGSDGILLGPLPAADAPFGLRIFNPDGSEAEKSGNGLRIFARYLFDQGLVANEPFAISTLGGRVEARILDGGARVKVDMGRVRFTSGEIPVAGAAREVVREFIEAGGRTFEFTAATIGNPHCVIPVPKATPELAQTFGPHLETHPLFPNRTNVQFLEVIDRHNIRIEIWERGAGYTLASGSSSSASAAIACKLGFCDSPVTVHMPGGVIHIEIDPDYNIRMTGPVTRVASGTLYPEILDYLSFC